MSAFRSKADIIQIKLGEVRLESQNQYSLMTANDPNRKSVKNFKTILKIRALFTRNYLLNSSSGSADLTEHHPLQISLYV